MYLGLSLFFLLQTAAAATRNHEVSGMPLYAEEWSIILRSQPSSSSSSSSVPYGNEAEEVED
ncbi:hypothetical protein EYF80_019759 [Liparis tanakae]|uniref:Uncharacterized protein n=1 Tax=Liparis tanakae TaxID=230148 RepID=A0A4Z2HYM9_9TELE|nr:hypothetical protein EYF80_019759 [Liparis tanakae]